MAPMAAEMAKARMIIRWVEMPEIRAALGLVAVAVICLPTRVREPRKYSATKTTTISPMTHRLLDGKMNTA